MKFVQDQKNKMQIYRTWVKFYNAMLSGKVKKTHTKTTYCRFPFKSNPSKGKTECRSVGAWGWEWEEDITFKVIRGIFGVMEIFHILVILPP